MAKYRSYAKVVFEVIFDDDGETNLDDQAFDVATNYLPMDSLNICDIEMSDVEEIEEEQ